MNVLGKEISYFTKFLTGYYATTLPGTKYTVFSLNTLIYSIKRKDPQKRGIRLTEDPLDPLGQFEWLDKQLSQIGNPKSALMMAHIPPTEEDYSKLLQWKTQYQRRFLEILKKHQTKILWLGFGHLVCRF